MVLLALALRERMGAGAPTRMRLAVIAASISSALFVGSGVTAFQAFPGGFAAKDVIAFGTIGAVASGLEYVAIFAFGWAAILQGWAGLATKGLPMALSYVLILRGLAAVLALFIPILGLLGVFVNLNWAFWLGYVLLSQPAAVGALMKPAM